MTLVKTNSSIDESAEIKLPGLGGAFRRQLLAAAVILTAVPGCADFRKTRNNAMARLAPWVKPHAKWEAENLFEFLRELPPDAMTGVMDTQKIKPDVVVSDRMIQAEQNARQVQKYLMKISSNAYESLVSDPKKLDYHALVQWLADKASVPKHQIEGASTFELEHELQLRLFDKAWDKLTPKQREDLLAKIDPNLPQRERVAKSLMTGAAVRAALATTIAFSGFAFYTTLSTTIHAVAASVGVTLPFVAYTGASSAFATLAGPVGWALVGGYLLLGAVIWFGTPDVRRTTALVLELHALKAVALNAAHVPERQVFRR